MSIQAVKFWKLAGILFGFSAACVVFYQTFHGTESTTKWLDSLKTADSTGDLPMQQALKEYTKVKGQHQLSHLRMNSIADELKFVDIDRLNTTQIALTLHSYLDNLDIRCRRKIRMGDMDDGGWEVCDDPEVRPVPPCIIYSFGTGKDWTFDEDVSRLYGCHVFAFDPSLNLEKHDRTPLIHFYPWGVDGAVKTNGKGWPMYTMQHIKESLGHTNKVIDIVKMDIESSEWSALPQMIASHSFDGVKQLYIEFHVTSATNNREGLKTIQTLEKSGWKRFYVRKNIHCMRKQRDFPVWRTSCYEVMYMRQSDMENQK